MSARAAEATVDPRNRAVLYDFKIFVAKNLIVGRYLLILSSEMEDLAEMARLGSRTS